MKRPFVIAAIILIAAIALVAYATRYHLAPGAVPAATTTAAATYVNASTNDIVLSSPLPGSVVSPAFTIEGEARGMWYFEASFPILLIAADGTTTLAQLPAQAQSDWMTEQFVPFKASIDAGAYRGPATLLLKRDNPSGLPEHDASLSIPIVIGGSAATGTAAQ